MNIEDLSPFALTRVTAYEGLAIDAEIWTAAHTYHQTAQRLHARVFHGWGILTGMEVTALSTPGRGVVLQPGVAVDREGRIIRVPQPVRLAIPPNVTGTVLLIVRFAETPLDGGPNSPSSRANEFFNF